MLISTMNDIPGHQVDEVFGEVFGLIVRSRNIGSTIGAGFKSLKGGELKGMTKMLVEGAGAVTLAAVLGMLPLAVASGSSLRVIREMLELCGIRDRFLAAVSSEETPRGKPAPDVFLEAARRIGVPPGSCLALEDSAAGVEAALAAGTDLQGVYLEVLSPAMASIGDRWAAGELDVATEHRASGIAHRLIGRLGPRFVRRGRTRGVVVLGTAAHERHALPLAVLGDLARSEGFEVSDLGADLIRKEPNVCLRFFRQFIKFGRADRVAHPARQCFVDRFDLQQFA